MQLQYDSRRVFGSSLWDEAILPLPPRPSLHCTYRDHAPLQWLSAQKTEGLLARWALAIQEYDFTIRYRNGGQNNNADALSRMPQPEGDKVNALQMSTTLEGEHSAATTCSPCTPTDLQQQQHDDPLLCQLHEELFKGGAETSPPQGHAWRQPPLRRYRQIWPQLTVKAQSKMV